MQRVQPRAETSAPQDSLSDIKWMLSQLNNVDIHELKGTIFVVFCCYSNENKS